jgi:hypothetical protein
MGKAKKILEISVLLLFAVIMGSCGDRGNLLYRKITTTPNSAPVANAGPD